MEFILSRPDLKQWKTLQSMIRATYFDLVLSFFFVFFSSHNMLNRGVTCPRRHINWPGDRLRADADCPCAHLPHSSTRCNLSVQALLNPNRRCISRPMYACEDTHEFRQGWGVVILYAQQVAKNKSAGGSHGWHDSVVLKIDAHSYCSCYARFYICFTGSCWMPVALFADCISYRSCGCSFNTPCTTTQKEMKPVVYRKEKKTSRKRK